MTSGHVLYTIDYVKLILDSDCLIKIAKSGVKEALCRHFVVEIPPTVKEEVVDLGKRKGLADADLVEKNLAERLIRLSPGQPLSSDGEDDVLNRFQKGGFDAIGTDDRRFIRRLRRLDLPYVTPGTLLFLLMRDGGIDQGEAENLLRKLSSYISLDEYETTASLLKGTIRYRPSPRKEKR